MKLTHSLKLAVFAFYCSFAEYALAGDPHGFGLIKFGEYKEKAIQLLVEKYDYKQLDNRIVGNNGSVLNNSQKTLWITHFPISKTQKMTVWFFFNANDKFYKYEIESTPMNVSKNDDRIKKMADFMGKVFQKKFGAPDKKYELSYLNLKEGYISIYQKWEFEKGPALIAYKLTNNNCHVIASARNSELETEKLIPQESVETSVEIDEAAGSF